MANKSPRFVYYTPAFEDIPPEPTFQLWIPTANGFTDVCADTLYAKGHLVPSFPVYETWRRLVLEKKKCGRCYASVRGQADLVRHNTLNHPGATIYFPPKEVTL